MTREPMPREAMTRDAMLRPPPRVERQRRETVTEEAGAPHLPDPGPALQPSFELATRAPPEPKRAPAPRLPSASGPGRRIHSRRNGAAAPNRAGGPIEPVVPTQSSPAPEPRFLSAGHAADISRPPDAAARGCAASHLRAPRRT